MLAHNAWLLQVLSIDVRVFAFIYIFVIAVIDAEKKIFTHESSYRYCFSAS